MSERLDQINGELEAIKSETADLYKQIERLYDKQRDLRKEQREIEVAAVRETRAAR